MLTNSFTVTEPTRTQPNDSATASPASTMVLQPRCRLDRTTIASFRLVLEQALHQAAEAVVLDLIWVETIDTAGLEILKASVHLAHRLRKSLSFQAIDWETRAVLEAEKESLRTVNLGDWSEVWQAEFCQFLGDRVQARLADAAAQAGAAEPTVNADSFGKKLRVRRIGLEQGDRVPVRLQ